MSAGRTRPAHAPPPRRRDRALERRGRAARRFVVVFAAVAVGLFALYQWSESSGRFRVVNVGNAAACAAVLRGCGIASAHQGTHVRVGDAGMDIISECSAIYVLILFAAAVLAFPTTWRARLRGLGLGIPLLLAVNIVRLVTLGLVLRHRPGWLPLFHEYLWQIVFVLVVAALYLVWIERMVPGARTDSPA
jgi:archaeosortase B (VPXXXP-CTERM-specific)